jgi:hypothetical protein
MLVGYFNLFLMISLLLISYKLVVCMNSLNELERNEVACLVVVVARSVITIVRLKKFNDIWQQVIGLL